ncbi:GNAT family N-acetyltransferase [Pseudomonas sp. HK3]
MNDAIQYTSIEYLSGGYQDTLVLRNAILRVPLGLTLSDTDTANEDQQLHIGAFSQNQLIGCVVIAPVKNEVATFRIRQMAISETCQGKGIGKSLLMHAEEVIKNNGGKRIILDARVIAQGFYESLKYTITSDEFIHNTIPHIMMEKRFT